jgi:hypothetical protein
MAFETSSKILPKEYKSVKPPPISKDTSHIVSIFSCPHYLPCGWCDKRDVLCNQMFISKGIESCEKNI